LAFAARRKTHSFATNFWFCNEANALVGATARAFINSNKVIVVSNAET